MRVINLVPVLVLLGALAGCATADGKNDPLKNTRKLAVEGHVSLYKNGAFRVPNTPISLIPPGPSALDLVEELVGLRARQSFVKSLEKAAQSVTIVSEGTKLTFHAGKGVQAGGDADSELIKRYVTEQGTLLVVRSSELGKRIVGKSWDLSRAVFAGAGASGEAVAVGIESVGSDIGEAGARRGAELAANSRSAAKDLSSEGVARSTTVFSYGANLFVKGYAAVPMHIKKRMLAGERLTDANVFNIAREVDQQRSNWSNKTVNLMADSVKDYAAVVSRDLQKAGGEFNGDYETTGVSLAALKSMRWVLQGLLGDAVIVPAAKITAASLGYVGVNLAAFPSMVVVREGVAVTELAVEANWDAARGIYDLTAPTAAAALAGLYGLLDGIGSQALAGATAAGGTVAGYGEVALAKTAEVVVKGAGYGAGEVVEYIGVPLASAGILVGGGTVGAVVGGVGATSGGALYVTGQTGSATASVAGDVAAGTTLVGGTSASVGGGAAYGVYQLSKAAVVPPGYELKGGIVLGYGTLSQLSAQAILAAADCSYMVLSLEGPKWVLYAVKGKLGNGENLPVGAIVDLKKMHEAGEEIESIPQTPEEMRKVVESVYGDLPELKSK